MCHFAFRWLLTALPSGPELVRDAQRLDRHRSPPTSTAAMADCPSEAETILRFMIGSTACRIATAACSLSVRAIQMRANFAQSRPVALRVPNALRFLFCKSFRSSSRSASVVSGSCLLNKARFSWWTNMSREVTRASMSREVMRAARCHDVRRKRANWASLDRRCNTMFRRGCSPPCTLRSPIPLRTEKVRDTVSMLRPR